MNSKIDVSICIVNWNVRDYLDRCLRSIKETTAPLSCQIIVVDNASSDNSLDMLKQKYPNIKLIENKTNLGFATATNQALDLAKGDTIFLLNPDTELLPQALQTLLDFIKKHPNSAIVAPKLLNTDGSLQPSVRRFPNFKIILYRYTILKHIGIFSREEAKGKMADFSFEEQKSVDQPAGAALLIRRDILEKVGRLDPTFFLFYEEVDLCRRIKRCGYDIMYLPASQVVHHGGKSRQNNRHQLFLITLKSLFYYLNKHHGEKPTQLFKWFFKPLFIFSTVLDVLGEGFSYWVYRLRKDAYRAKRKKEKCHLKAKFLRHDLFEFLFRT